MLPSTRSAGVERRATRAYLRDAQACLKAAEVLLVYLQLLLQSLYAVLRPGLPVLSILRHRQQDSHTWGTEGCETIML